MTTKRNDLDAAARGQLLRGVTPDASAPAPPAPAATPPPDTPADDAATKRAKHRVVAYMTPAEYDAATTAAKRSALSVSAWARQALLRAAGVLPDA